MSILLNPREAYGKTLVELAAADKRIVALDADLAKSTRGILVEERFPERHFEMSIAEQNMVSVAVGLALGGKIPFVHSFAVFLTGRAYDQIRVGVALARSNVKLIGSSAGLSDYGDGATHQSVEDVALMRALPNMTVIVPSDATETAKATRAIAKYEGPVYLRLNRNDLPAVFPVEEEFCIGKVYPLRQGKHVTVFASGIMVSRSLEAAEILAEEGIETSVINVSTIKPLDREAITALARETGAVVVAEEHSVIGGLGSAIAEALRGEKNIAMEFVGIEDVFGQSACNYHDLLTAYNLTSEAVLSACRRVVAL
ncbi:transketolase [Moorella sp. E308F]|uniref:transketolase family protein n=1 Tax=Moorella sp. E308F TaxID=2572682 RepID=UPI0010FFABC1|nr:transketolase C-terminal domain-containing protein [Moorella sp. E308F]GEA15702.1 transketolase [Moorella sp. E308F]